MESNKSYSPNEIEAKWYAKWEENDCFRSIPDDRESFSIVIPPPNVTGVLHMGHMLNNTIQDVLIRKARLEGKNACWVPGTDHASIATEAKVVKQLRSEGIKKSDLTRDEFLKHAWDWTDKYGGIILKQLRKLGASANWERTAFTMDERRYKAVIRAFVDLYKKGKLYRQNRMVNWDPVAKTVLSNEEVIYKEESGKLYHINYKIVGEDGYVTIATTRPETLLGDTALAVHPEDERFQYLKGKQVEVPLVKRHVPIIFDEYVEREFGTGALKVTPAHDPNDYDLGKKHSLETIDIFNDDGSISEAGQIHIGLDRFEARKAIVKTLQENGQLINTEDLVHNVGRSERTNCVVEPKLSLQWYVDMKSIVQPAIKAVEDGEIVFHPKKYVNTYMHWMTNIRDWCISRQLWWGQRIPAYYYDDKVYVSETIEDALAQALNDYPHIKVEDLRQDEDVLDTWFSSWLWPISVFEQNERDLEYYYPTSVLVTGWDIIFLWVARMIMAGYEWKGKLPFKDVYFTGMVRDKQRRKMSKSLGNSPDALKMIEDYGADAVRYGMLSCSPAGGDLLFDIKLVENGRNFTNKIWNASNYIMDLKVDSNLNMPEENKLATKWINNAFSKIEHEINKLFKEYRISEALISLYSFIWNDVFSSYLEMMKPPYGQPIDAMSHTELTRVIERLCLNLHPFMPFITEEVYALIKKRENGDFCINADGLKSMDFDEAFIGQIDLLKDIISKIRDVRNKNQLKPKEEVEVKIYSTDESNAAFSNIGFEALLMKMAFISNIDFLDGEEDGSSDPSYVNFISSKTKLAVKLSKEINLEEELAKAMDELTYQEGFVSNVEKKLSNERFVNNAPAMVVDKERKKLSDGLARIEALKETIKNLKDNL